MEPIVSFLPSWGRKPPQIHILNEGVRVEV
jgi:hypothetical protein